MKKRSVLMLFLAACTGCTSYSFRGTQPAVSDLRGGSEAATFTVTHFRYVRNDHSLAQPWSIAGFAGPSADRGTITHTLERKYPQLFSRDDNSIPVSVEVSFVDSSVNCWGLVPYFLSLGTLPSRIVWLRDSCTVRVGIENGRDSAARSTDVAFSSKAWLSVWTPFGLFMSDDPGTYTGAARSGSGIMAAPHLSSSCLQNEKDVFAEAIADAVASCVSKLDQSEIKRISILQSLRDQRP